MGASNQPSNQYGTNMRGSTQTVDRCTETLNKLGAAITKYNIDLWELFKKYDKSDNYSLDRNEFG